MSNTNNVKRLQPKTKTLRELYLLSGNQCAFTSCTCSMVNTQGDFIGEVCHIEAAMPGGERFNNKMSNEERRDISNLMLMCHMHHVETNNVEVYTVERMKEMKRQHENKFKDMVERIKSSITDHTKSSSYKLAINCLRLCHVLSWEITEEQRLDTLENLNSLLCQMIDIPLSTRKLFGIMIMRAYTGSSPNEFIVPLDEVKNATNIECSEYLVHLDSLKRRGLISSVEENPYSLCCECKLLCHDDWDFWRSLQKFCQKTKIDIELICTDLDFTVFDE